MKLHLLPLVVATALTGCLSTAPKIGDESAKTSATGAAVGNRRKMSIANWNGVTGPLGPLLWLKTRMPPGI